MDGTLQPSDISPEQNDPAFCAPRFLYELVALKSRVAALERILGVQRNG